MPASMNAIAAPGREPGRVRPSVSSAEPLSTNAERIDTCSTPQNTNMKPTRVSVSQATSVAIRPSGEYHASRRSRFASDSDGRASTRNTCCDVQEDPARDERDAGPREHDRLDRRPERDHDERHAERDRDDPEHHIHAAHPARTADRRR